MGTEKICRTLILEDDASWAKKFQRYLKQDSRHHHILVATNYQEALALVELEPFDLVILDANLTDLPGNYDGLRVGSQVWRKSRKTKIIVVSGSDEINRRLQSLNFVPSYIIRKPEFDEVDFMRKIDLALKQEAWSS